MTGAILKATNSSFQKGMTFCRSIYVKKVMKLLAFIFEQPSYVLYLVNKFIITKICIGIDIDKIRDFECIFPIFKADFRLVL